MTRHVPPSSPWTEPMTDAERERFDAMPTTDDATSCPCNWCCWERLKSWDKP